MRSRIILVVVGLTFLRFPMEAPEKLVHAGGYMIPHQTARGLALSNALTAGVNDPSAVYYNPAALSDLDGNNLLVSGT